LNGEDPLSLRDFGEARWSFAVVSPNGETEALATAEFRTDSAFVAKATTAELHSVELII